MQPARSAGKTSPGQANTGFISLCLWVETWREIYNPPVTPDHQPHTNSTPLVAFLVEGLSEGDLFYLKIYLFLPLWTA